jgi:choline transport protein
MSTLFFQFLARVLVLMVLDVRRDQKRVGHCLRSITSSMALNGALGFSILLAAMYALGDADAALGSPTALVGYSILGILKNGINSVGRVMGLRVIIIFMQISGNVTDVTAAFRCCGFFQR